MAIRLSIIASHPIQYQVPLYRALAALPGMDLLVHYGFLPDAKAQGEGFGVEFSWDIPLLGGYRHEVFGVEQAGSARAGAKFRALGDAAPTGQERFLPVTQGGAGACPGLGDEAPLGLKSAALGSASAWVRNAKSLFASLRTYRPDAILCTGWHHPVMYAGLAAAVLSGRPKILRCEANTLRRRRLPARLFQRTVLDLYDAFLPIGMANREYYRTFGVREDDMFDAPYFIDNARFAEISGGADRAALRARWGIPPDAFCFLFSGKLEEKKNPLLLVEAMRGLTGAHLLIAGSGDLEPRVRGLAADLGVGCSFAGFLNQSEIPLAYAAADCLVLPSDAGETWGLVVNEAMACGRPAIVSDLVGCRQDLVEEGVTGLSFPCGEAAALAAQMQMMAAHPENSQRMGAAARRRVFESYSVDVAADGVMQAVRRISSP